ncbi:MAG: UDP-N-acetylmuramate dehydrogenase [Lachnospiraceae bacterium]|nr:UDP-N-acetylmuramate dehydrogenase [Lachnospiraceae bacterium]
MLGESLLKKIREYLPEEQIFPNQSLKDMTTFRAGGGCSCLLEIDTEEQLCQLLRLFGRTETPYFILGNGSNTLVKDAGYSGIVLHIDRSMDAITVEGNILTAEAGAMLSKASRVAAEHGLTGLEFAAGIPGSVGGGVVMNAGAYDGEMKDVVKSVRVVGKDGEILELRGSAMEFGYRTSVLRNRPFVVTSVTFELKPGNPEEILGKMEDFNRRRREKQPLEYPSAGSTFKRPEGHFAGQLIMEAGMRGFQIGGARVSDKHCGFIINAGGASAADILDVMGEVQDRVYSCFGVRLEPEIVVLGDPDREVSR